MILSVSSLVEVALVFAGIFLASAQVKERDDWSPSKNAYGDWFISAGQRGTLLHSFCHSPKCQVL